MFKNMEIVKKKKKKETSRTKKENSLSYWTLQKNEFRHRFMKNRGEKIFQD